MDIVNSKIMEVEMQFLYDKTSKSLSDKSKISK